ncbi:ATP-binding protein [Embleya hyalina]|uniref:ATP-binding protein n=1 Tax=Embleya hyalina TaxID=516124 RepID=A0A401YX08_9ACTN|nr:ATP-binding protein [Embleya hyalina]GCD99152.1 ATP-binding protein [Embleya hyalina]
MGTIMQTLVTTTATANPGRISLGLPATTESPGAARRIVESALVRWLVPGDSVETMLLVVSELVTNAVAHGKGPVGFSLSCGEKNATGSSVLRVEVTDASCERVRRRQAAGHEEHGRGLALVEALADRWGQDLFPQGKRVWCEIGVSQGSP